MKKITFYLFVTEILLCSAIYSFNAYAEGIANVIPSNKPSIKINDVTIGLDNQSRDVSTVINVTNTGNTLNQWQFGFCYMQEFFVKLGSANPNLVMQICDSNNHCANLTYLKAPRITDIDLSAGYTTILTPATSFPLTAGKTYDIKLLHSNQGLPSNYANVPQNFFMITNNQMTHISTDRDVYELLDYNQNKVTDQIKTHIETNWNNSSNQIPLFNRIIPSPVSYVGANGAYSLENGVTIHNLLPGDGNVASMFAADLASDLNIKAFIDHVASNTGIIIQPISDPSIINNNPEGYQIQIQPKAIVISVLNDTGEFYALQTLRQLWNQNTTLAAAVITDYPRFKYRGVMLDTARHFFSVDEIKSFIDLMASQKLNTLHIHFADDEGFRLNLLGGIIGATRGYGQMIGPMVFAQGNLDITNFEHQIYPYADTLYSHFYSAEEIQQLITYANSRKITIIPEIDIPGHARALIKSLPGSFVDPNDQSSFVSVQGYTDDVIPVCTYNTNISVGPKFTANVNAMINQIAQLFNGQTTLFARNNEVSVGADEVSSDAWTKDPSCQGDWANLTALDKNHKFFADVSADNPMLLLSGWQQLVQNDDSSLGNNIVPPNQVGHIWVWNISSNGINQAINLAQNNYPTVLDFADQTYLDLTYTPDINEPGFTWATNFSDTYTALSSALSATATINGIQNTNQKANILGIEGTLWSENLATYDHLIYMALPKMAGLAEASWSPAAITGNANRQLDWHSLAMRLGCGSSGFLSYLNKLYGVHYRGYPRGISLEVPPGSICQ